MNLLFLLAQHHWTGAAEPTLQIARGLAARDHRVTFVFTRGPAGHLAPHVEAAGLATLPDVTLRRKGVYPFSTWRDARRLRRFVGREDVDAVFCHHSHDHWLGWWVASRAANPPVVVREIHESRQLLPQPLTRGLFRRTDALAVAARRWKQTLIDRLGLDPSRIYVLPPAVDTGRFHPQQNVQAIRAELRAKPDDRLIGMVSRIKAGRGHDLALAAFARLRQQTPNVRLLFVGRGEGEAELRSRVNVSGLADRVYFLGYRTDDLPAIYAALDVHLLLGEGSDGTCRAALEAMACGTPVVALPVGTLPETIHDGETGLLVEHDPEALAAAVEEVLSAPHLRERARGYAERELSLERRVDTAEKMFLELTGVRRQTAE